MPSLRKRIGYLPSTISQKIITKLAKKEKLSQSKVVGILVEEALMARGEFDTKEKNYLINKSRYGKQNSLNNTSFTYNDLDELISDKGITYNKEKYKHKSDIFFSENHEAYNRELFEEFKQFILFQKMKEEEKEEEK